MIEHTIHSRSQNLANISSNLLFSAVFSERELTFTFAICYRPSVCLSVVCNVRGPTQAVQIFGNISTALGTSAIHWHPLTGERAANFRLLANQWAERRLVHAMTSRLPRYEAKCVQRRCFLCGSVPTPFAFRHQGNGATPSQLIPLERQLIALQLAI